MQCCPVCKNRLVTLRVKPFVRGSGVVEKYVRRIRVCRTNKNQTGCGWEKETIEVLLEDLLRLENCVAGLVVPWK